MTCQSSEHIGGIVEPHESFDTWVTIGSRQQFATLPRCYIYMMCHIMAEECPKNVQSSVKYLIIINK